LLSNNKRADFFLGISLFIRNNLSTTAHKLGLDDNALNLGLDQGDIIFTGTPAGVGPVLDGDGFAFKFADKELGNCIIKLLN